MNLVTRALVLFCLSTIPSISNAQDQPAHPFSAVARANVVRADPGGYLGQAASDPNRGVTSVAVEVTIETEHVRLGRGWDVSLDFVGAHQPLMVMVKAPSWTVVRPAFIDGLSTMAGGRIAHATRSTETAVVGMIGAARIDSKSVVVGSGPGETASIAANDIAEWAFAFGGGIEFRWYLHDTAQIHDRGETLMPLVRIHGGVKHDQRFRRDGDLADFNDPTGRVSFGFDVQPLRIARGARTLLSVGGGFLMEAALRTTDRLPSGYAASVGATINLGTFSR